jgi:hypothetical protein
MTIGRFTSDVDLYAQLRLDVYLHGRTTGRLPPPNSENGNAASRHARQSNALSLDLEDRQRPARWGKDDGATVVPFDQSSTLADQEPDYGGTAEEAPLALEVGSALRDPLLAKVARLYVRTGHPSYGPNPGMVGIQLNVMA